MPHVLNADMLLIAHIKTDDIRKITDDIKTPFNWYVARRNTYTDASNYKKKNCLYMDNITEHYSLRSASESI